MDSYSEVHHAIQAFIHSFAIFQDDKVSPNTLSNGVFFAGILTTVENFDWGREQLNLSFGQQKWTTKLYNLKKLVERCQYYFQYQLQKGVKTRDIDLLRIAKDSQIEEIAKLFEVVISVLMEAPNKSDYIESIMSLDERSQSAFVEIIKNSIDCRVCSRDQGNKGKMAKMIHQLQTENLILQQEIESMVNIREEMGKTIKEYEDRLEQIQTELDRSRSNKDQTNLEDQCGLIEKYESVITNLKMKLINTTRDHESQLSAYREQISKLEQRANSVEQLEEVLEIYKERYQQVVNSMNKVSLWEREKIKLNKTIQEKDVSIHKMHEKIQQLTEKILTLEEREIYMKVDQEKREKRLRQLEKDIKNKYYNNSQTTSHINSSLYLSQLDKENISRLHTDEDEENQNEEFKRMRETSDLKIKQLTRQNQKLAKKLQKNKILQSQNKKLESILYDMTNQKNEEMQIMVATLYESYKENHNLFKTFKFNLS